MIRRLSIFTGVNTITNIITSAMIGVFLSRGLSVEERGQTYFLFQIIMVMSVVLALGMSQSIIYSVKNRLIEERKTASMSFLIYILVCFSAFLNIDYIYNFIPNSKATNGFSEISELLIASMFFMGAFSIINAYLQTKNENLVKSTFISIVGNLVYLLLFATMFFFTQMSVESCLTIFMISWIARCTLGISVIRLDSGSYKFEYNDAIIFIKSSFLFYINIIVFALYSKINLFVSGFLLSSYEIGLYSVSLTIIELIVIVPSAIGTIMFPYITGNLDIDKNESVKKISKMMFEVSFLTCFFIVIFGRFLIEMMYGENYIESYYSITMMLPGALAYAAVFAFGNFLNSGGYTKKSTNFYILSTLISIPLIYFSCKYFSISGAAIAYSISNIILCVLFLLKVSSVSGSKCKRDYFFTNVNEMVLFVFVKSIIKNKG